MIVSNSFSVPAFTIVAPLKPTDPDPENVCVPVPFFVSDSVPLVVSIEPVNVVEVLSPPVVSVTAVALLSVTIPAPASEPMLFEKPARSKYPLKVTAELVPKALVDPAFSVPAVTAVVPE